jgi:prepilin-type N-terminal cleavage/methylation domain-containing protein
MHDKPMRGKGFTLLELLIVIAMIAVLSSIGYPKLLSYQRGMVFRDARNLVMQILRDASTQAIVTSTPQTVKFFNQGVGSDITVTANGKTRAYFLEQNGRLSAFKASGVSLSTVIFDVRGRPNNTAPLVMTVNIAEFSGNVRLLPTGKTVMK